MTITSDMTAATNTTTTSTGLISVVPVVDDDDENVVSFDTSSDVSMDCEEVSFSSDESTANFSVEELV